MSFLGLLKYMPERPINHGARNLPRTIKVGDVPKEELIKRVRDHIYQMDGYRPEIKLLEKFLEQIEIATTPTEINLRVIPADCGAENSWPKYHGAELNRYAQRRGLEFCTPEMVCKMFLLWRDIEQEECFFYVSCGDLVCLFQTYSTQRDRKEVRIHSVVIGNDRFNISFAEDVVYLRPRKSETAV